VTGVFYIVGPTATGKSEIAAEVALACKGEVISADAFQIYAGLDLLTAKPDRATLDIVPHHLIGSNIGGRWHRILGRSRQMILVTIRC
jgi:tRNA dimethylallyltransferase